MWLPGKPGGGADTRVAPADPDRATAGRWPPPIHRWADHHPVVRHAAILLGYVALGVVVTWPRATYLAGRLPNTRDQAAYTWDMWWMARQAEHFANPFYTHQIIAPVGAPLSYHALMPLAGLIMMPITIIAGPAFSVNLLSVFVPGLTCYAMYRAARLWLPPVGAFASGAFFGLSSMLTWRAWFHLNIAAGALFLPITLETAVRLRRDPSPGRAALLGLVIGLCLLVDTESAVLAVVVAAAVLMPWLVSRPRLGTLSQLGLTAATGLLVASPLAIAMVRQASALSPNPAKLATDYVTYGVALPQMFAPSPRVAAFGLHELGAIFYHGITSEGMPTFGVMVTALALLGAVLYWRQRRTWIWLVLWLGMSVLALGPVLYLGTHPYAPLPVRDHGTTLSQLLPYTWFVRLPGLSGFREANRFTPLALLPAALLAGSAVAWIRTRFTPALLLVAALAALELGWSAQAPAGTMPTGLAAADRAVAADHSRSLVVDVPLGFRSGTVLVGPGFPGEALVEATLDGHPRAIGYVARLPEHTAVVLRRHHFYADVMKVQRGRHITAAAVPAAAADAKRLNVGWVLVWKPVTPALHHFLAVTGFGFRYRADGVSVYRALVR